MNLIIRAAAIVTAIGVIGGAAWGLDDRYATKIEVAGNSQSIQIIQIENAARSGNRALLTRLCDDFLRVHGWSPTACR